MHSKKEREHKELEENYSWLDSSDERKIYDRSRNIGQIYRFRKFMPNKRQKKEVMEMI